MKRQSREDFLNKIDDSPSPDITGDSLTCDYGITNLYNHRRSSSSDSQDSGIGSTGSSRQSSLSSMNLETKTNPYPLTVCTNAMILYNYTLLHKEMYHLL